MRRLTRRLAGGWDAAIAGGWRGWCALGLLRGAGGRGRAHHARPGGQSRGLTDLAERRGRKIKRRGFRGMRQRRLNGWMTRPRTPCSPGAGICPFSPYRTCRRNANHKTIRGTIPHSPSSGPTRPIYHTSCTHIYRTGNPSTSAILLMSAYLSLMYTRRAMNKFSGCASRNHTWEALRRRESRSEDDIAKSQSTYHFTSSIV